MNRLKITCILILSTLFFLMWNTAEARFIKSDTLDIGDEAPQFVMRDLITNNAIFLRDYTGKTLREEWKKKKERHVVVLSFWATWCQPCKSEISILTKVAENYKNLKVKFFLVNTLERAEFTEDSVRIEYNNRNYSLPCLIDPSGRYASRYSIRGLPVLVVIDKFGIVKKINRGNHENFELELEQMINELLGETEFDNK